MRREAGLSLRIGIALSVAWIANTSVLAITYPIWEEFSFARYPRSYWIGVYAVGGLLSTVIAAVATACFLWFTSRQRGRSGAFWQILTVFSALSVWAVLTGVNPNADASWPDLIRGADAKLFAEAQFLRFIFCDAIPMAIISWLLVATLGLERRTRSLHPPS